MTGRGLWIAVSILLVTAALSPAPSDSQQLAQDRARLAAILKKASEYCRRLERAALDFVCLEEVTETSHNYSPDTNIYLYDYQFVRKNEEAKEKRDLIAVNGKKTKLQDSRLHIIMFEYKNVLFGPVGLLSESWQRSFGYRLVREETVRGQKAVVIEATPGPELTEPHCYGKVWVNETDGSVLKIVWDQRSLGNFQSIAEWAKLHEAEPQITAYSEFGFEKNGLRFPSRSYTEQAYIRKDRTKLSNAELSIVYKGYKFFTVETEVKY